jgi:hypothetical protein
VDTELGFDKMQRTLVVAYENGMVRIWKLADQLR